MDRSSKILILGADGMVGDAIRRVLLDQAYGNVITATRTDADLTDAAATQTLFALAQPEYVILAAARVGGIHANDTYPVDFLHDNLLIQLNTLFTAHQCGVRKLVFLGSSCIYPKLCDQPIKEEYLLSGPLEPTNEPYAVAKIAGIKLCQSYRKQYGCNFISLMPTNLYGYGDNYHPENSHVIPGLIRRFHEAKRDGAASVTCWGTGSARREFLFADDMAESVIFCLQQYDDVQPINIGSGGDIAIRELATMIAQVVGFEGKLKWDTTKPDGTPQKLLDTSRLTALGWQPKTPLRTGLELAYQWFCDHPKARM